MYFIRTLLITIVACLTLSFALSSECKGNSSCPEKVNNGSCGLFKTECSDGYGGVFCCPYSDAVCCNLGSICCRHGQTCIMSWPWGILRCSGPKFTEDNEITLFSEKATPDEVRFANFGICPTRCYGGCCPLYDAVCCPDRENCCPVNYECAKDGCVEKSSINPFLQQKDSRDDQSVFGMKECPGDINCPLSTNCCLDGDKWNCCPKPRTNEKVSNGSCGLFETECSFGCCPYPDAVCCPNGQTCCRHGQVCYKYYWIDACAGPGKEITLFSNKTTPVKARPNVGVCPTSCYGECCPLHGAVCCPDRQNCCPANHECTKDGCIERSDINTFLQQKVSSGDQSTYVPKKCPGNISCPLSTNCCLDDDKWSCCPKPRTNVTGGQCCYTVAGYKCCTDYAPFCTIFGCI